MIRPSDDDPITSLSFIGGDGHTIVHNAAIPVSWDRRRNSIGLAQDSPICRELVNGIMIVPERLRNDFPQDTQMSLILNPENPPTHCHEDSLFYAIPANQFTSIPGIETSPRIVVPNQPIDQEDNDYEFESFTIDSSEVLDKLSATVFDELMNHINEGSMEIPRIINDCNFSRYPSIHFRIRSSDSDNVAGVIVYGPEDYLEHISETQCILKVERSRTYGLFGMNFISKIAIHLTPDRVGFCDPSGL